MQRHCRSKEDSTSLKKSVGGSIGKGKSVSGDIIGQISRSLWKENCGINHGPH